MPEQVTHQAGKFLSKDEAAMRDDLIARGHDPQLITEKPGDVIDPHEHAERHILVQVAGRMTVHVTDQDITMVPGDEIYIPPHVEHGATMADEGSQYLWVEF